MQDIKQVLCVSEDGVFVILRLIAAWLLVLVHTVVCIRPPAARKRLAGIRRSWCKSFP